MKNEDVDRRSFSFILHSSFIILHLIKKPRPAAWCRDGAFSFLSGRLEDVVLIQIRIGLEDADSAPEEALPGGEGVSGEGGGDGLALVSLAGGIGGDDGEVDQPAGMHLADGEGGDLARTTDRGEILPADGGDDVDLNGGNVGTGAGPGDGAVGAVLDGHDNACEGEGWVTSVGEASGASDGPVTGGSWRRVA